MISSITTKFRSLLFPGSPAAAFFDELADSARQKAEANRSSLGMKRQAIIAQETKDQAKRQAEIRSAVARESAARAAWTTAQETLRALEEANERLERHADLRVTGITAEIRALSDTRIHDAIALVVREERDMRGRELSIYFKQHARDEAERLQAMPAIRDRMTELMDACDVDVASALASLLVEAGIDPASLGAA